MNPTIQLIVKVLDRNRNITGTIKAFVFGSAIQPNIKPNDIDLLIIYHELWQPKIIRQILTGIDYMHIHLIFMFPEEEVETDFIALQDCIELKFQ